MKRTVEVLEQAAADLRSEVDRRAIPSPPTRHQAKEKAISPQRPWLAGLIAFALVLGLGGLTALRILDRSSPRSEQEILGPTPTPVPNGTKPSLTSDRAPAVVPFDSGPLAPRDGHSVVWTGSEVIVWGGATALAGETLADGAAYDPVEETWRPIAPAPLAARRDHHVAWTGQEMLVVGGIGHLDGAAYNPASDTWRQIPDTSVRTTSPATNTSQYTSSVWTGERLVLWNVVDDQLAAYSSRTDEWELLPAVGLELAAGVLRWNGHHLYIFGVEGFLPEIDQLKLARLDSDAWSLVSTLQIVHPVPMLSAWIGDRFVAWNDEGVAFESDPTDPIWIRSEPIPISGCEGVGDPLELVDSALIFGWCGSDAYYDTAVARWQAVELPGLGSGDHSVWTGSEVIHWGDATDAGGVGSWRLVFSESN